MIREFYNSPPLLKKKLQGNSRATFVRKDGIWEEVGGILGVVNWYNSGRIKF